MGMTYWLHMLNGREMTKDDEDHSLMHRLSDELDAACDHLKIPKISSFADFTDLEFSMADDDMDDDGNADIDPETGYGYGIDAMRWFDIASGKSCLEALRSHVETGWESDLDAQTKTELLEELDDCLAKLRAAPLGTDKFHLAVIM